MRDRILVVDDDDSVLRLLEVALRHVGYDVRTAGSPGEALEAFTREPCDLLIVDRCLPGATGLDVARQLRELYPDLPVIMVTAYPEPLLSSGPPLAGYLVKPFQPLALLTGHVAKVLALTKRSIAQGLARPAPPPRAGRGEDVAP